MKKYEFTKECIMRSGCKLYRIKSLKSFDDVKVGELGGFIEKEDNLSQEGDCWVYYNAKVHGNAKVFNNAKVYDNALVSENAKVFDNANVFGNTYICGEAQVYGEAKVYGYASINGKAQVCDKAVVNSVAKIKGDAIIKNLGDYIVFKNFWSSGRMFTWTKSNNMWEVGCFYGTGGELIARAYKNSQVSGDNYKRVVEYVKSCFPTEK